MPQQGVPIPMAFMAPYGGMGRPILIIIWVEIILATFAIALRFYTKYVCSRPGGWSLFWASWSWLIGFIAQIIITAAVSSSLKPSFDTPGSSWTTPRALMLTWIAILLTFLAVGLSKVAIVAFILALQAGTHFKMRVFMWFVAISNVALDLAFLFYILFRCSPPSAVYNLIDPQKCNSDFTPARNFGFFVGSYNVASDLFLAFYPLYLFQRLQIPRGAKAGLSVVMSLGFIAAGCGAVKTWDLEWITNTNDLTYDIFCIIVWTFTELWCVLLTSSVPPLWPLAKKWHNDTEAFRSRGRTWLSGGSSRSRSRSAASPGPGGLKKWLSEHTSSTKSTSQSHSRRRSKSMQHLVIERQVDDVESGLSGRNQKHAAMPHEQEVRESYETDLPIQMQSLTRSARNSPDRESARDRREDAVGKTAGIPEESIMVQRDISISCEERTTEDASVKASDRIFGTSKNQPWPQPVYPNTNESGMGRHVERSGSVSRNERGWRR